MVKQGSKRCPYCSNNIKSGCDVPNRVLLQIRCFSPSHTGHKKMCKKCYKKNSRQLAKTEAQKLQGARAMEEVAKRVSELAHIPPMPDSFADAELSVNPVEGGVSKRTRGRPQKYTSSLRKKLALLTAKANTSLRGSGKSLAIITEDPTLEASHATTSQCLIEVGLVLYRYNCIKLAKCSDLFIMVDGSGTGTAQRTFFLIYFGGTIDGTHWSAPFGLLEFVHKGAEVDLLALQSVLEAVSEQQRNANVPPLSILNFMSITFDNCSENMGRWTGLGERIEQWRKSDYDKWPGPKPSYSPLCIKGCTDHIVNIISKTLEKVLAQCAPNSSWLTGKKKDRHVATTCIINIYNRLQHEPFKRPFRSFLVQLGCKKMPYLNMDISRYSIIDIAARTIHRFAIPIYLFYIFAWPQLTANDRQAFEWFRSIQVRAIIKMRALLASTILLPWMEKVAKVNNTISYQIESTTLLFNLIYLRLDPATFFAYHDIDVEGRHLLPLLEQVTSHKLTAAVLEDNLKLITGYRAPPKDVREKATVLTSSRHTLLVTDITPVTNLKEISVDSDSKADSETVRPSLIEEPAEIIAQPSNDLVSLADVSLPNLLDHKKNKKFYSQMAMVWEMLVYETQYALFDKDQRFIDTLPLRTIGMTFTTRKVERDFGVIKMILQRNRDTRTLLLLANLLVRNSSARDLQLATDLMDDNSRLHSIQLHRSSTRVEQVDALYFGKFVQATYDKIKSFGAKQLNQNLRPFLEAEKIQINIDEKITKPKLIDYLRKKGFIIKQEMTKADLLLKMRDLVDEQTARLIDEEVNTLEMRRIKRVTNALVGEK